jgi:hypothetical protein
VTTSLSGLASPKLGPQIKVAGYQYYAGFAANFVGDLLSLLDVTDKDLVLDPWNGSGTTTLVSSQAGVRSIGIDLNPVMAVISKGRLQPERERLLAIAEAEKLLTPAPQRSYVRRTDPLLNWFTPGSVSRVRELVARISRSPDRDALDLGAISVLECHLLTAAFVSIRQLAKPFLGSNPTWIRSAKATDDLVRVTWRALAATFLANVSNMAMSPVAADTNPHLVIADSAATTLNEPASVIITSPPYCTRIDYAVATRLELSLLGMSSTDQDLLRRQMLGTTTVPRQSTSNRADLLSATARAVLRQVETHPSQASSTYYVKWLAQFMSQYEKSMNAVTHMAVPGARAALVVQDSYYKNVRIDLAQITEEICSRLGWELSARRDFYVPKTMAGLNTPSRAYRTDFSAVESLLIFKKRELGCETTS